MKRAGLIVVLSVACLFGQQLHPSIDGAVYPPLARQARIQGPVKFAVSVAEGKPSITLISGHPVLVNAAKQALQKWSFDGVADGEYRINYVYQLDESGFDIVTETRKQGNALDRFFLRMFRRPTTVKQEVCVARPAKVTASAETVDGFPGATVVVQAGVPCLETSGSQIAD